jgi:hypothetical protein
VSGGWGIVAISLFLRYYNSRKWLDEEDEEKKKKIKRDPIEIAEAAILNWRPVMRLKGVLIGHFNCIIAKQEK